MNSEDLVRAAWILAQRSSGEQRLRALRALAFAQARAFIAKSDAEPWRRSPLARRRWLHRALDELIAERAWTPAAEEKLVGLLDVERVIDPPDTGIKLGPMIATAPKTPIGVTKVRKARPVLHHGARVRAVSRPRERRSSTRRRARAAPDDDSGPPEPTAREAGVPFGAIALLLHVARVPFWALRDDAGVFGIEAAWCPSCSCPDFAVDRAGSHCESDCSEEAILAALRGSW